MKHHNVTLSGTAKVADVEGGPLVPGELKLEQVELEINLGPLDGRAFSLKLKLLEGEFQSAVLAPLQKKDAA